MIIIILLRIKLPSVALLELFWDVIFHVEEILVEIQIIMWSSRSGQVSQIRSFSVVNGHSWMENSLRERDK